MKFTNKLNLPLPLVEAIVNSGYSKGASTYTATGLIEPTRISILKERFETELEEDVSNLIYSLQGQSIHTILERAALKLAEQGYVSERRFYLEVSGCVVGAQIDIFHKDTGLLQDYKVTSVYSVKDGAKEEYVKQLNIQAYILEHGYELIDGQKIFHKYSPQTLQIVAILRDWSKGDAERNPEMPQQQIAILEVPKIAGNEVLAYIEERVEERRAATEQSDEQLPLCSREERWARPDVWAVVKRGAKKALKLFHSEAAASTMMEELGTGYEVQFRQGRNIRCEQYCPVAKFCSQYQASKKKEDDDE